MFQENQKMKYARMLSSIGFHTFTMFLRLTYSEALELYKDFKKCTAVRVRPLDHSKKSPQSMPKGYIVEYLEKSIGVSWYIRFNSKVEEHSRMSLNHLSKNYQKEPTPYSVRATINPKILNGMNDYLSAARADSLDQAEASYNILAADISPMLGKFEDYRLNRVDYCFNFDPLELNMGCTVAQLFTLIRRGHIPRGFTEATEYCEKAKKLKPYKHDFRLKNKSMTISCYLKHLQLKRRFQSCPDLQISHGVIRFEIKCEYTKIYAMSKGIKEILLNDLPIEDLAEEVLYGGITNPTKSLLCDAFSENIIYKYFHKVIRKGDYFTLEGARWMVQSHNFRKDKEARLLETLDLISDHRGISKALSKIDDNKLSDVKRSLKDLDAIFVNPVTIPRGWGIPHISNPMRAYEESMYELILSESERLFRKQLAEYNSI